MAVAAVLGASAIVTALVATRDGGKPHILGGPHILVYSESAGPNSTDTTIWRANIDGTHAVRLTKGSNPKISPDPWGSDPEISPDGRLVALVRESCASRPNSSSYRTWRMCWSSTPQSLTCCEPRLYVARASDGKVRRIVYATPYGPSSLTWAPDSRYLAYRAGNGLYVLDFDSGAKRLVATGQLISPSFSPDSRFVVYGRSIDTYSEHCDLYVADLASGRSRRITHFGDVYAAAWGPHVIAFSREKERGVWLVDRSGNHLSRFAGKENATYGYYPAFWSADGKKLLLFECCNVAFRIIEVPSGRVILTGNGRLLGLSRDGKVALVNACDGDTSPPTGRVMTVPLDGGSARAVVPKDGICRASWTG